MGCCQSSCGLTAAATMTTAVVIPAVIASPGRPISVAAKALAPISTARAHGWNGKKIR